jgi:hypothetical protein
MPTVILNPPKQARKIVLRTWEADKPTKNIKNRDSRNIRLKQKRRELAAINPKVIPDFAHRVQTLPVYPKGFPKKSCMIAVVKQEDMHLVIGVQRKMFLAWMTDHKIPFAGYCVKTQVRGYPPRAFLESEVGAIVRQLNTHYQENCTFRSTDIGTIEAIRTLVERERTLMNRQIHALFP